MEHLRKRKTHSPSNADTLEEPLLPKEDTGPSPSESSRFDDHISSALVSYSVNRLNWEALLSAVADACKAGWSGVVATISNCLGTFFPHQPQVVDLSIEQEQRLQTLQSRLQQPYDAHNVAHQDALRRLWGFAFPGTPIHSLKDPRWTDMGWQRDDPASDFRGAGFIALENLLYMAQSQPELFQQLLHKSKGDRSEWEYPFAVAGINLTFMLEELLDLRKQHTGSVGHVPHTAPGRAFLDLLADSSDAFERIYCIAFEALDRVWLEMKASYMDYPAVQQRVRSQLFSALGSHPRSFEGLKALLRP